MTAGIRVSVTQPSVPASMEHTGLPFGLFPFFKHEQSSYVCRGPDDFCWGPAPVGPTLVTGSRTHTQTRTDAAEDITRPYCASNLDAGGFTAAQYTEQLVVGYEEKAREGVALGVEVVVERFLTLLEHAEHRV